MDKEALPTAEILVNDMNQVRVILGGECIASLETIELADDRLVLHSIEVKDGYRRQGLGHKMLHNLLEGLPDYYDKLWLPPCAGESYEREWTGDVELKWVEEGWEWIKSVCQTCPLCRKRTEYLDNDDNGEDDDGEDDDAVDS
jgi:hypothetical protein